MAYGDDKKTRWPSCSPRRSRTARRRYVFLPNAKWLPMTRNLLLADIPFPLTVLHYDQFWAGHISGERWASALASVNGFEGQMAAFRFNHYDVFEQASMAPRRQADNEQRRRHNAVTYEADPARSTANFGSRRTTYDSPVTFMTRDAYVALSESTAVSSPHYQIFFQFRTFEANGLLVFGRSNHSKDFIALEMKNGKLRYIFNTGDGPQVSGLIRRRSASPKRPQCWKIVGFWHL